MSKNRVTVEVPGRICLFGDKVDLLGKPVIAATVNAVMHVTLTKRNDNNVNLDAKDIQFRKSFKLHDPVDLNHPLKYWSAIISRLQERLTGFDAEITSQIPIGAGLSSSAAVSVSLIKALNIAYDLNLKLDEIAELAYLAEHDDCKIMCGRMDQYSIAYGGVTWIETGDKPRVERLDVKDLPIVVGDSQEERQASSVLNRVKAQVIKKDPEIMDAFANIEKIVDEGRVKLLSSDFKRVGELMTMQQTEENRLKAASDKVNRLCKVAIEAGAYGAKQMGAGGGGCMEAICPGKQSQVKKALENAGARPWIFQIYHYKD